MYTFGFNINLKMTPEHIRMLGETMLGTRLYEAIEVTYYEHMENVDVRPYNQAVKKMVETYHPQVTVHLPAFNLAEESHTIRKAILKEIEHCLDYTSELGGSAIIIHSGYIDTGLHVPVLRTLSGGNGQVKKSWALSVEMMQKACGLAEERGMMIYTENLSKRELTVTCTDLRQYLLDVGRDNLKIVFDIGHSYYTGNDIPREVRTAGKSLCHLHLHDNFGERDEHLSIGEGKIDYQGFCKALDEVGYRGIYMMELGECSVENLKRSREIISSMARYK